MRIFIGGVHPQHQRKFVDLYPDVLFSFASDQDGEKKWINAATGADHIVIDQARCNHRIIDRLRARSARVLLGDGKAELRRIIQEIIDHGTTTHNYAAPAGQRELVGWFSWW